MRVIVTGGGTGGHIYPAMAILRGIEKRWPDTTFLYAGTEKGLEADIVPKAGIPFQTVNVEGLNRPFSWRTVISLFKAVQGSGQSLGLIRRFKPDLVVGTGGYVCGPVVMAAALLGVPTLIHEQNAIPGMTNRILSRFADAVCVTFEDSMRLFPKKAKTHLTGLPVREEILHAHRETGLASLGLKDGKTTVVITGGSRGAKKINQAAVEMFPAFSRRPDIQFFHITGPTDFQPTEKALREKGIDPESGGNIKMVPYLYEMQHALAAADIIIGRAGASFLSEVMVRGIPSILIPYPFAAANHQEYNARSLEQRGAARVIPDRQLTGETLGKCLGDIAADTTIRREMADATKKLGRENALNEIIETAAGICEHR